MTSGFDSSDILRGWRCSRALCSPAFVVSFQIFQSTPDPYFSFIWSLMRLLSEFKEGEIFQVELWGFCLSMMRKDSFIVCSKSVCSNFPVWVTVKRPLGEWCKVKHHRIRRSFTRAPLQLPFSMQMSLFHTAIMHACWWRETWLGFFPPLRFRLLLRSIALANFDPLMFLWRALKMSLFSIVFSDSPRSPVWIWAGFTPQLQDLLPQRRSLPSSFCTEKRKHCSSADRIATWLTPTRAQTFPFLFLDSEPVFCGFFVSHSRLGSDPLCSL